MKDVRNQGGLSSADRHFVYKGKVGFFRCGRPHFLAHIHI